MNRFISKVILFAQILTLTVIFPYSGYSFNDNDDEDTWETYKSDHFIVSSRDPIQKKYIKDFIKTCEYYHDELTERLGFNRFDFWLFEDRATITVYKDKEDYLEGTGRARWSGASVMVKEKQIDTYRADEKFFDITLPHELAHIVLREFIGMKTKVPLWFEEGVASANEKDSILRYFLFTKGLIENGLNMPVTELDKVMPGRIKVPSIFYATSASIIIYLMDNNKKKDFAALCKELKDGSGFYEAMDKVYGIKGPDDLDNKFTEYIKNKSYEEIAVRDDYDVKW